MEPYHRIWSAAQQGFTMDIKSRDRPADKEFALIVAGGYDGVY